MMCRLNVVDRKHVRVVCNYTHLNDVLGSVADEIWDGPKGVEDSLDAIRVPTHVVF